MIKKSKTTLTRNADKLWREKAIEWYGKTCCICGNDKINIHHIISRSNRAVRWYIGNAAVLCSLHHTFGNQSAHKSPLWFIDWMVSLRGLEWKKDLIKMSNSIWNRKYEVIEPK